MASSIHPAGKSERHKIRICQRAHKAGSQNSPMLITSTFVQPAALKRHKVSGSVQRAHPKPKCLRHPKAAKPSGAKLDAWLRKIIIECWSFIQFQNLPKKPSSLQWGLVAGHTMPWCPTGLDQRFVFLLVICVILFWLLRKSETPSRSWFGLSYCLTCPSTGGECPIFRQHPFPFDIISHSILHFQKFIAKSPTGWMLENPPRHSFNREVPASIFGASASVFFFPMVASCPATGALGAS